MDWREQDYWGFKEFTFLLLLEFAIGVAFIKFVLQPIYLQWLGNALYAEILMGLTIAITLLLGIYLIALRPKNLSWSEVGVKKFSAKDWKVIILYSVIVMLGPVMIMLITSLIGSSMSNSKTEAMQQNVTFLTVLLTFITASIISPIYEEIFYRGFLYRWLRTRTGLIVALLISSTIFTVIHIPTYNTMPITFFGGIIFALAYEKTGSVWPSVIIHGSTNGIMVLLANFA